VSSPVNLREFLLENFAGDLEYHPRRALLYLVLGVASACFWVFTPADRKISVIPLIFALGSLTLVAKGVFLFRPSSEGLGLSQQELDETIGKESRKAFPPVAAQAAQIVQDFGMGGLLLWPLLPYAQNIDHSWNNAPRFPVFLFGALLFVAGRIIRRLTSFPTKRA